MPRVFVGFVELLVKGLEGFWLSCWLRGWRGFVELLVKGLKGFC